MTSAEELRDAADRVMKGGKNISSAALEHGIKRTTLSNYIQRMKSLGDNPLNEVPEVGYKTPRKVFSEHQEETLKDYLIKMSAIFHGCSPKEVRRLAYGCATKFHIKMPATWERDKLAGKDWLTKFLKRNSELSIRMPEATSLSRAASFNVPNVTGYFEKLSTVMEKYNFTASRIWNVDETGVPTVMKPHKVVAAKGKHNVGAITSAERGTNITQHGCCCFRSGKFDPSHVCFSPEEFQGPFPQWRTS